MYFSLANDQSRKKYGPCFVHASSSGELPK